MRIYKTPSDNYDVVTKGYVDRAIENIENNVSDLTLVRISQEEYNALESPDENTVYYVINDSEKITQYLGSIKLSGGTSSVSESTVLTDNAPDTILGVAEIEEV
jgi:hypothetical protein